MLAIRHRSASGGHDALWEFDPARGVIELVLGLGSANPRAFKFSVCFPERPRLWAHTMMRLDEESWRILPSLFIPILEEETGVIERYGIPFPEPRALALEPRECRVHFETRPCPLHDAIGLGTQLVLTHAPSGIDIELVELSL